MGLLLMIGMLAMILDSRTALQGASQGVELCLTAVIPSLLPLCSGRNEDVPAVSCRQ